MTIFGLNPADLQKAVSPDKQGLLRDSPYTVEQIAHQVGYQSALTLTRAYKRYFDMSPGSARKRQQHLSPVRSWGKQQKHDELSIKKTRQEADQKRSASCHIERKN